MRCNTFALRTSRVICWYLSEPSLVPCHAYLPYLLSPSPSPGSQLSRSPPLSPLAVPCLPLRSRSAPAPAPAPASPSDQTTDKRPTRTARAIRERSEGRLPLSLSPPSGLPSILCAQPADCRSRPLISLSSLFTPLAHSKIKT